MAIFARLQVRLPVLVARCIGYRPPSGGRAGSPPSRLDGPDGLEDLRDQLEADIVSSALSARLAATVVHRGFVPPHRGTPGAGADSGMESDSDRVGVPDAVIYEIEAVVERLRRALTGLDCVSLRDEVAGPPDSAPPG